MRKVERKSSPERGKKNETNFQSMPMSSEEGGPAPKKEAKRWNELAVSLKRQQNVTAQWIGTREEKVHAPKGSETPTKSGREKEILEKNEAGKLP